MAQAGKGAGRGDLRRITAALVAALLLAVLVPSGLLLWHSYRDAMRAGAIRAENAAQIVGAHVQWVGEAASQALRRIDAAVGERPDLLSRAALAQLDTAVATLPPGFSFWLFDHEKNVVIAQGPVAGAARVAASPYYRALRDGEVWGVSRLMHLSDDGESAFAIGRRIERNGAFAGAAVLVVPSLLLTEIRLSLEMDGRSSIALFRTDGWLVARHPPVAEPVNFGDHPLFTEHLPAAPRGSFRSRSPIDGVERVVGYYRVRGMPLVAVAGLSRDEVAETFGARMVDAVILGVPIALLCTALFLWAMLLLREGVRQRQMLAAALERNTLLLGEIHHRVKNNLATVAALINIQPLPPGARQALVGRISAIAAVHEGLYGTDRPDRIALAHYIGRQIAVLQASHRDGVRVEHDLAEVEVGPEAAMPLGLIINEVLSNAFKHAFPDGRSGLVSVTLQKVGPCSARLEIRDNGIGRRVPPEGGGMGSRIIRGLSQQIGADYAYSLDEGTVFTLVFPLTGAEG